jgi:hypothetical protein
VSLSCSFALGVALRLIGSVVAFGLAFLHLFGRPSDLLNIALMLCRLLDALLLLLLLLVSTKSWPSGAAGLSRGAALAGSGAAGGSADGAVMEHQSCMGASSKVQGISLYQNRIRVDTWFGCRATFESRGSLVTLE